jgi:O-antigen biosynthesis protein
LPVVVYRRLGWTAPGHVARLAWRHLRTERQRLHDLPFASRSTSYAAIADAIRWVNPAPIPGGRRTTLLAPPDSRVEWRTTIVPHARVAGWCALLPEAWNRNAGGVRFAITVDTTDGRRLAQRSLLLQPSTVDAERHWRRLAVRVGNTSAEDVRITFETCVAAEASRAEAWSVWGDPQIERDRSLRRMLRLLCSEWKHRGVAGVLTGLRVHTHPSGDAARLYQRWVTRHTPDAGALQALAVRVARLTRPPRFSVVVPVNNTDPRWLRAALESVATQVYPHWELCIADEGATSPAQRAVLEEFAGDPRVTVTWRQTGVDVSIASNDALAQATGEYVAFLEDDDILAPDALAEMALAITAHPDVDVLYSDEDKLTPSGQRCDPVFKPGWSPEQLLGEMYTGHLTVARTALLREVGGFRTGCEGVHQYDLWLRMAARTSQVHHVPKVLYHRRNDVGPSTAVGETHARVVANTRRALEDHLHARAIAATVEPGLAPGLWRVRRRIVGDPDVTIVIPTAGVIKKVRGKPVDLLAHAVRCVISRTSWPKYRLLIVDNGDLRAETLAALSQIPHDRLTYAVPPGPFNFPKKLNFAVSHVRTEFFTTFNDDIEIITPDWIQGLLEYGQDHEVGAVGCKLRFPDGRLQHVGVAVGVTGIAAHLFHQAPADASGWNRSVMTVRNYSAVTAALMMTRREVWDRVGGFDERLRMDYNDVDYCLKLRQIGYRIVYTPFVEAYHHESGSFGSRLPNPDDIAEMQRKWPAVLNHDPYYNPNLSRDTPDCGLLE